MKMAGEYDLRTNKIVLAGKLRKLKRLHEERKTITEEISALNELIAKQEKGAEDKK